MRLLTVGQIATKLGTPIHRITFAIKQNGIEPSVRVATYRLFNSDAVDRIEAALAQTSKRGKLRTVPA